MSMHLLSNCCLNPAILWFCICPNFHSPTFLAPVPYNAFFPLFKLCFRASWVSKMHICWGDVALTLLAFVCVFVPYLCMYLCCICVCICAAFVCVFVFVFMCVFVHWLKGIIMAGQLHRPSYCVVIWTNYIQLETYEFTIRPIVWHFIDQKEGSIVSYWVNILTTNEGGMGQATKKQKN